MKRSALLALGILLAMLVPSHSKPAAAAQEVRVELPPCRAKQWTLDNGLTILVEEDHSAPVASVQAWCRTGSIDEGAHLGAGLSHILEHMLFKGTTTRSRDAIAQTIQDQGGAVNAYTSYDRTVYYIDVPAAGVPVALDILADIMVNSTLPVEEYTKEQEVIRREFAMNYDNPDRMVQLALFDLAFTEHPVRHPVIGHLDIYNGLTRDDVLAYYKARYVPNNLVFVVVGDVDGEAVRSRLEQTLGKLPRRSLPSVALPEEPPQLGRREQHREFATDLTRLQMAWHIPAITHPDVPALDLLSVILGGGRSSRLHRVLREEKRLVHSVAAYAYTPGFPGLFGVTAVLDPEQRRAVAEETARLVQEVTAKPVGADELRKAKKQFLSGHFAEMSTMSGKAADLGSNWLIARNPDFSRQYLAALQDVTAADIQRVAGRYLRDQNLTVVSFNPPGTLREDTTAGAAQKAGEIQKFELPNGLRLLVCADRRLPQVSAVAAFKGGLLDEDERTNGITQLCSMVLLKGTTTRSAARIASEIEDAGGSLTTEAGNNSLLVGVHMMRPDFDTGLEVLADVLLNPALAEPEIAREKEAQLAGIKAEEDMVLAVAQRTMRSALFGGHPYGRRNSGTPESIARITRDDLLAFHRTRVTGRNGVLAVFGDVDVAHIRKRVEKLFAALPAGEPRLTQPPQPAPLTRTEVVETVRDKAQAVVMIGYPAPDLFSPDREALDLVHEACTDLASRLFIRIREEMGLAYYVSSAQLLGLAPGAFYFYLGTAPEKVGEVRQAFEAELARLGREGLQPEEFARARAQLVGQEEIALQSSAALAKRTALDELYGLGFDHYRSLRQRVEAVTLEDVQRVCRTYFHERPHVVSIVQPPARQASR